MAVVESPLLAWIGRMLRESQMDPHTPAVVLSERRCRFPRLTKLIDPARLDRMIKAFSEALGVPCALMGQDLVWIGNEPNIPHFCCLAHKHTETASLCSVHSRRLAEEARKTRRVAVERCRSGLWEFIVPVEARQEVLAFIRGGPILEESTIDKVAVSPEAKRALALLVRVGTLDELRRKAEAVAVLAHEIGATALAAFQAEEVNRLAATLTYVADEENAFDEILNSIERVYGDIKAGIYEWTGGKGTLIRSRNGSKDLAGFEYRSDNSIVGRCAASTETLYHDDLEPLRKSPDAPETLRIGSNIALQSALTVPVITRVTDGVRHCVQVCSTRKGTFGDPSDRSFLKTVACLIGATQERLGVAASVPADRVEEEIWLRALSEMNSQLAAGTLDEDQTLDLFLQTALGIANCESGEILFCTPYDRRLRVGAARGVFRPVIGNRIMRIPRLVQAAIDEGEVQWLGESEPNGWTEFLDVQGLPPEPDLGDSPWHALVAPIATGQQRVGALVLHRPGSRVCGRRQRHTLLKFAACIGGFLQETEAQRLDRAHLDSAMAAASIFDLAMSPRRTAKERDEVRRSLYRKLVEAACKIPRVKHASVRQVCPVTKRYYFVEGEGAERDRFFESPWYPIDPSSAGGWVALTQEPYVFGTPKEALHYRKVFDDVCSHASFPVRCAAGLALVFSVDSDHNHAFEKGSQTYQSLQRLVANVETILAMLDTAATDAVARFGADCLNSASTEELCGDAAHVLRDILDTLDCTILLTTPAGDEIEVAGTTGLEPTNTTGAPVRYQIDRPEGCTGWVGAQKRPLVIENLEDPKEFPPEEPRPVWIRKIPQKGDKEAHRLAFLGIPILVGSQLLGVVRFSARRNYQRFTAQDIELAERLAAWLGMAIQRIRFMDRMEAARELQQLALGSTVRDTANALATKTMELLRCDAVHVRELVGDELRLICAVGRDMNLTPVRALGAPFSGIVAKEKRIVTFQGGTEDDERRWAQADKAARSTEDPWVKSLAHVPLAVGERVVGTISFHSEKTDAFGTDRTPVLEEIARHGGLLLYHARIHEDQLRWNRASLTATKELNRNPNSVTLESAATDVADAFLEAFPLPVVTVWLTDESKSHFQPMVCVVHPNGEEVASGCPPKIRLEAHFARLIKRLALRKAVWAWGMRHGPPAAKLLAKAPEPIQKWSEQIGSAVLAPLWLGEELVGAVLCHGGVGCQFSLDEKQKENVAHLARQAAVVLNSAMLQESQRRAAPLAMIGAFLDAFLRQMATPVNHISLLAHNSRPLIAPGSRLAEKIASIGKETLRLEKIIDDLKSFVAGGGTRNVSVFDLSAAINEVIDTELHLPGNVRLATNIADEPIQIAGVEPILAQAVHMVIQNALEAMPGGGVLTVRLSHDDGNALLEVEDTGSGMSNTVLKACQETFFTTKQEGTGLGLAVTRAAVNWHSGQLRISSDLDQGTVVTMQFPLGEKP